MQHHTMLLNRTRGFTLMEILVVVVIIGISLTFVLLKTQLNARKKTVTLATQLTQVIAAAQQQAFLRPAQLGLHLSSTGYEILENDSPPLNSPALFRFHPIDPSLHLSLSIDHQPIALTEKTPPILFWPSGEMTPFLLEITDEKYQKTVQLIGEANGTVVLRGVT